MRNKCEKICDPRWNVFYFALYFVYYILVEVHIDGAVKQQYSGTKAWYEKELEVEMARTPISSNNLLGSQHSTKYFFYYYAEVVELSEFYILGEIRVQCPLISSCRRCCDIILFYTTLFYMFIRWWWLNIFCLCFSQS